MAYQKLQTSTGLNIFPTNDANIPFPNVITSGIVDVITPFELEDTTANFTSEGIQVGDVVWNTDTNQAATVVQVLNATNILLNADIFTGIESYKIYVQNSKKEGCVLYIGTGGNLRVITASGQDVVFFNILGGSFLPVNVVKVLVTATGASDIVALW